MPPNPVSTTDAPARDPGRPRQRFAIEFEQDPRDAGGGFPHVFVPLPEKIRSRGMALAWWRRYWKDTPGTHRLVQLRVTGVEEPLGAPPHLA